MRKIAIPLIVFLVLAAVVIGVVLVGNKKTKSGSNTSMTTNPQVNTNNIVIGDVGKHASPSDCWTAIDGNVYNITDFIPNHPGGGMITAACGIDATSIFNGQGHSGSAMNTLDQYQIGVLAK